MDKALIETALNQEIGKIEHDIAIGNRQSAWGRLLGTNDLLLSLGLMDLTLTATTKDQYIVGVKIKRW